MTSGGLLIAVPPISYDMLRGRLVAAGDGCSVIGTIESGSGIFVE